MDYLFFDVECANCFNGTGKLCEFGYVLTDDKFNIKEKQNFLINPDEKFDHYVIKNMLNFTKEEYLASPKFNEFYPKIYGLLTAENTAVVGHTVGGDAKYVGADCMRYKLSPPDFEHIDIVEIYKGINDKKDAVSLVKMSELFNIEVPDDVHCALTDAELTMRCAEALAKNTGLSLLELAEKYPRAKGKLENYREEYLRKKLYNRFIRECKRKGLLELNSEQKKNVNEFRRIASAEGKFYNPKLRGKKICISYNYEGYNYENVLKIIQLTANFGARNISRATKCDIFVKYDIKYKEGLVYCQRLEQALVAIKGGKNIEIISFDKFLSLLGVTENKIMAMENVDLEKKREENAKRPKKFYHNYKKRKKYYIKKEI